MRLCTNDERAVLEMCSKPQPEDIAGHYATSSGFLNDVKIPPTPRKFKIHSVKGNSVKWVLYIEEASRRDLTLTSEL